MNEILAGIYGTGGFEKVAQVGDTPIQTLSDLAALITYENLPDEQDLTKVASVHNQVLEQLVDFDRSGRTIAQLEFSAMEKAAAEGNPEALQQFFGQGQAPTSEIKQAIYAELQRRASAG